MSPQVPAAAEESDVPVGSKRPNYHRQSMKQRSVKANRGGGHGHRTEETYEQERERRRAKQIEAMQNGGSAIGRWLIA